MRGQLKLFTNILPQSEAVAAERKGRNAILDRKRNELIAARYYYYITYGDALLRKHYDSVIETISGEFCLTPRTVIGILDKNYPVIVSFKDKQAPVSLLKKKWPHFNWA